MDELKLTDKEKAFLSMLFTMANVIIQHKGTYIELDYEPFTWSDLFNLSEKIGVQYD